MRVFTTSPFLVPEQKPNLKFIFLRFLLLGLQWGLPLYCLEKSQTTPACKVLGEVHSGASGAADWISARPVVQQPLCHGLSSPKSRRSLMDSAKMNLTAGHLSVIPGPSCVNGASRFRVFYFETKMKYSCLYCLILLSFP